jgi:site-specific DNA-methyltransferase (adenine-specific)
MNANKRAKSPRESTSPRPSTRTVGRGRAVPREPPPRRTWWSAAGVKLVFGDSLTHYGRWPAPDVIVSDGGYGVLGFDGDTSDHLALPRWYAPHIEAWSRAARLSTTLWFWNSELGWAAVHPLLERAGWRYVSANVWNKGKGHIAGNVNTRTIRRFPVVSEICVHYVREPRLDELPLKQWLRREWKRTGLPLKVANTACGVRDAAVRKYLDQSHLWYWPPVEMFRRLADYANEHGDTRGRPYFSIDGARPLSDDEWRATRATFHCPHGVTNVWDRPALRGPQRLTTETGKAVHLNQKPLDLMERIITAASEPGDIVWEPFGGLFTGCLAAMHTGRRAYGAELDATYFRHGVARLKAARAEAKAARSK